MGNLFSNVYVARGDSYRKVPITVSSKEHFVASLNSQELNGDGSIANVATLLPRIGLDMVSCTYDSMRKTNIANRKLTVDYSGNRPKANKLFNPVPYDFEFEVSIYTRHQDDAFQIIEQILPYFQPQFNTMIKELDENEVVVDQRDIPIILESAVPESTFEGSAGEMRHIEWTLNLRLKGWLYPPTNSQFGEIRTIYLNFQDEEQVIIHAERESVTSEFDINWLVRKEVSNDADIRWRYSIDSLYDTTWNTRASIIDSRDLSWETRRRLEARNILSYSTRVETSSNIEVDWDIRSSVGHEYIDSWELRNSTSSDVDVQWRGYTLIDNSVDVEWDMRDVVSSSTDVAWKHTQIVENSSDIAYNVKQSVESEVRVIWHSGLNAYGYVDVGYDIEN